jgi:hypothetical protein
MSVELLMDFERLNRELSQGHVSEEALSKMCGAEYYEAASTMNFLKGCLKILYGVAKSGRPISVVGKDGIEVLLTRGDLDAWCKRMFPVAYACFFDPRTLGSN